MAYEYDIFVSYKRHPEWTPWVREFFVNALHAFVGVNFPSFHVFFDEQIESGAAWSLELKRALLHSRVLLSVLSPQYFSSNWCVNEMSIFLEREQTLGLRTSSNPGGLIIPMQLHDGDFYPAYFWNNFQARDMKKFANRTLRANPNTLLGQDFDCEMQVWSPEICQILSRAPAHDSAWEHHTGSGFFSHLHQSDPHYGAPPRLHL